MLKPGLYAGLSIFFWRFSVITPASGFIKRTITDYCGRQRTGGQKNCLFSVRLSMVILQGVFRQLSGTVPE